MRQVHAGVAQHGFTAFAHHQTAGRGQRARQWLAQPGSSLMMSVVLEPSPLFATPVFAFSMAMAVAAYELLKKYTDDVKIKWPNDLYIGDRKAGGILIDNLIAGTKWKVAVVGIGLNINQISFGDLANKAISLQQVTGKMYDPVQLAKELCAEIERVWKELKNNSDWITTTYRQQLYKKGEQVKLKSGARIFEARIVDVNNSAQLVVQHAVEETFNVGEVEWLL